MSGFDHDFSHFDAFVPYTIRKVGGVDGARSENLEVIDKRDGRVIKAYTRNYPRLGLSAFYPFKHGDDWFAFISPLYNRVEVISLARGETVARQSEKIDGEWCPGNFYVPAYHKSADGRGWLDYLFSPHYPINPSLSCLHYTNIGFACGVYWGGDEGWLTSRLDIPEIIRTGIVQTPKPDDPLCVEICTLPEIRQFLRMDPPDWEASHSHLEHERFQFYRLDTTLDGFRSMPPRDWN